MGKLLVVSLVIRDLPTRNIRRLRSVGGSLNDHAKTSEKIAVLWYVAGFKAKTQQKKLIGFVSTGWWFGTFFFHILGRIIPTDSN